MKRVLIWDVPVRLFHGLLGVAFVIAFAIPFLSGDDGPLFSIHMLFGAIAAFMVLLRLVWGFVGSRWARFRNFEVRPNKLAAYVRGAFSGGGPRYTGHNPGSSIAAILMFAIILGLAATGILMGNGGGEFVEELHEILAWSMIVVIGAHLAGIAWHTLRHRENISKSMVDGRKVAEPSGAIASVRPVAGLLFVILTGLWAGALIQGYDAATSTVTVPILGQTVQVGEGEHHQHGEYNERGARDHRD